MRTTIEQGFGVLKKRFRVLDVEPFWSFPIQVKVVLACYVVYNHTMGVEPNDHIMEDAMNQVESSDHQQETQSRRESVEDSRSWNAREMRYAKLCGLIIPGVESSILFRFL